MSEGEFRARVAAILSLLDSASLGSFERAELLDELHDLVSEHLMESLLEYERHTGRTRPEAEA